MLAAQLVVIGASPNSNAQEPPPAQAVPVEEMSALNSALLATLTEKFYRSTAFKVMGGGLVAAALFRLVERSSSAVSWLISVMT